MEPVRFWYRFPVIAGDSAESRAKLFMVFGDAFFRGRIFKSKYLYCGDVRQVFQFVRVTVFSLSRVATPCCAITTLFRRRGQFSIAASNSSPA
jgi:hypothetical protein